jgi:hypothetical protein
VVTGYVHCNSAKKKWWFGPKSQKSKSELLIQVEILKIKIIIIHNISNIAEEKYFLYPIPQLVSYLTNCLNSCGHHLKAFQNCPKLLIPFLSSSDTLRLFPNLTFLSFSLDSPFSGDSIFYLVIWLVSSSD